MHATRTTIGTEGQKAAGSSSAAAKTTATGQAIHKPDKNRCRPSGRERSWEQDDHVRRDQAL